jgi:hypothetical protein
MRIGICPRAFGRRMGHGKACVCYEEAAHVAHPNDSLGFVMGLANGTRSSV